MNTKILLAGIFSFTVAATTISTNVNAAAAAENEVDSTTLNLHKQMSAVCAGKKRVTEILKKEDVPTKADVIESANMAAMVKRTAEIMRHSANIARNTPEERKNAAFADVAEEISIRTSADALEISSRFNEANKTHKA